MWIEFGLSKILYLQGHSKGVSTRNCEPFSENSEDDITFRSDDNKNFGYLQKGSKHYVFWCKDNLCNNFLPSNQIQKKVLKGKAYRLANISAKKFPKFLVPHLPHSEVRTCLVCKEECASLENVQMKNCRRNKNFLPTCTITSGT